MTFYGTCWEKRKDRKSKREVNQTTGCLQKTDNRCPKALFGFGASQRNDADRCRKWAKGIEEDRFTELELRW